MSFSKFAVQRPVFTTMIALIVVVLGVVSLMRLRIDLLPEIEVPTLSVSTNYEGADPDIVERLVTRHIEEIVSSVPGVTELSSQSSEGRSRVRVTFSWGTDLDVATSDVRARLEEELGELPDDVDRPQIRKFDVNSFPVVILGVSSDLDPIALNEIVEDQIRSRFERISGVAQVDLWGGYERELRIELNPDKMQALKLSTSEVVSVLLNANVDIPAGTINESRFEVTLRAPAEFIKLSELEELVVQKHGVSAITLGQIATLHDTNVKQTRNIRVDDALGIRVAIRKASDANTVEVARLILEEIEATNKALPQLHVISVENQGNFIQRSINNVANSVLYGGMLAILILLFFLRSVRSTLVIAVSIPLSILATFFFAYAGGLTLNLMTLGGLALGVGMMVDNSIVVLENIFRRRHENDESVDDAAINGSNEVTGAIIASTITTLVIFLPLMFIEGVSGHLFGDLALVVVYALVASLLVALTLVPMLASRFLRGQKLNEDQTLEICGNVDVIVEDGKGNSPQHAVTRSPKPMARLSAWAAGSLQALEVCYQEILAKVLRHPYLMTIASALILVCSLFLFPKLGSEFMPPSDEGSVRVSAEFEGGTRLELADQQTRKIEAIIARVPELQSVVTSVSAGGGYRSATTSASVSMDVGAAHMRQRSNTEIANDLRKQLTGVVAGATVRVNAPQGQFLLQRLLGGDDGLSIELRGADADILEQLRQHVRSAVSGIRGITDVEDDVVDRVPQEHLTIDRRKAADLGLSMKAIAQTLEANIGGKIAGDYRPAGLSIPIRVQYADADHLQMSQIYQQTIINDKGEAIALGNVLRSEPSFGPAEIVRKDQQRSVTMQINIAERDTGSVAEDIQTALATIAKPPGYQAYVSGSYKEQQQSFADLSMGFLMALLLVYMVLASQYESFRDPLIVMFSVPVAAIGVLVTLYMTHSTINVQSGIGCIMLAGIVVNNAILLVDQTGQLRRDGMRTQTALLEAGRRRLRPILMTTTTTILGLLPLALGIGEGADGQAPLARAVVGGLVTSTMITLLLIPAIYALFHHQEALEYQEGNV